MRHTAYVFDAYGTLFDVHSAVRRHANAVGPAGALLSELWRTKQLEYSWVRTLMGAYADFWQLTEQALDYALARLGIVDPTIRQNLLDAYRRLECFPEVPPVLKSLKASGAKLAHTFQWLTPDAVGGREGGQSRRCPGSCIFGRQRSPVQDRSVDL